MNRVALINVYIGNFPNYFKLWELSAGYNKNFDFHFYCDKPIKSRFKNIFFHKITLQEFKSKVEDLINMQVVLEKPYKICEYRPLYGLVFEQDLKDYTHWGYFDIDLIFGDLSKFVTDELLNTYDKIYRNGHLTIYKNNERMNNLFKVDNHSTIYTYKTAFNTNCACFFDEIQGISAIAENEPDIKCYKSIDFADINYKQFRFMRSNSNFNYPQIYKWQKGKLFCYYVKDGELINQEVVYCHLQKRQMENDIQNEDLIEDFAIVPNKFINIKNVDKQTVLKYSKNKLYFKYYKNRIKHIFKLLKQGYVKEFLFRRKQTKLLKSKYGKTVSFK